jgi:hypothetical protein
MINYIQSANKVNVESTLQIQEVFKKLKTNKLNKIKKLKIKTTAG